MDYLFGQVAIDKAFVDWSGNCGNLSAAVGAEVFAPRADTPFGAPLSLLAGGALWNPATHPGERSSWVLAGIRREACTIRH